MRRETVNENTVAFPPLSGIRVIELGSLVAGPFCGQLLADFGAEVIKVERPLVGDSMREWGRVKPDGYSLWWPVIGRNKKSVTIDLRQAEGQAIARALVAKADIVVENFRPGTMENWGLGYDDLKQVNSGIVMVRVSGFGQTGPYSTRPGYGAIGEAMGGLRYVVGHPDNPPSRMGISIGDSLAGTFAAFGAMLALRARERSGEGQVVDSAIYEAVLAMMECVIPEYALGDFVRERTGSILPTIAPSNVYPSSDGQMILIAANQDTVFRRLATAMRMPDLATDPRFSSHTTRGSNQTELDQLISTWSMTHTAEDLVHLLVQHNVPVTTVYRAPEMLNDPHYAARKAIVSVPHPHFGDFPMQNVVPQLSATPGEVKWTGPELGQHNGEILHELLGMSEGELCSLTNKGVI